MSTFTILMRGGTAAEWTAANPVLHAREMGLETDTLKFKFGDGATDWVGLAYASGGGSGTVTDVTASAPLASTGGATPNISASGFDGTNSGLVPAGPNDASKFLDGTGNFTTPAGGGTVTDVTGSAPIASSGGTTPDISISDFDGTNGGAVPDGPNDATKYLDGTGNFTVPAGGGTVTDVTATAPMTSSGGTTPNIATPDFVASGASHAAGLVPDPGASGGTTKFLREDASWQTPGGMVKIAQVVTVSSAASVDFSSIPNTYTDLIIIFCARSTAAVTSDDAFIKINNDGTAANYATGGYLLNVGSTPTCGTRTASTSGARALSLAGANSTANFATSGKIVFSSYSKTTFFKTIDCTGGSTDTATARAFMISNIWKSTTAINQITIIPNTAFLDGSVFTLYGLG